MAGIATQGNSFNLPNYHGRLISLSPEDTPFLSMAGGLTGGKKTSNEQFEWQTYDLRDAANDRQRVEGANAPTVDERVRANVTNIVEIHQEAVEVSYSRLAAVHQYAGVNNGDADNPVTDELAFQVDAAIRAKKLDINRGFLRNTKVIPTDNTTARVTQGILGAVTTNVVAKTGTPTLTASDVIGLLQTIWAAGGISQQETATLFCNGSLKRWVTKLFITDKGYAEGTRNVGGVHCDTIQTDFGVLNVVLERQMPTDTLLVASMEECAPVFREIPGKGFLFVEPLAKVGAADKAQLYGELGLEYGNQLKHGKITGLLATAPS